MGKLQNLAMLVRDLGAERATAVAQIERLRQQRDQLDTAPLPKSEIVRQLAAYVDAQLQRFDSNLAEALQRICTRPNLRIDELQHGFPMLQLMGGNGTLDERLLTALFGDALKERCAKVVDRMSWPDAGPPAAQREDLRAKLDEQIEAAITTLTEIDAGLAEMGLTLENKNGR